jgi:hypothetical protein
LSQIREGYLHVGRSIRWGPLVAFGAVAVASVALVSPGKPIYQGAAIDALRRAAFFIAMGAGAALDDPAATTIESAPPTLGFRRALRVAALVAPLVVLWASALVAAHVRAHERLPVAWLTLELGALCALSLAVAAAAIGRGRHGGTTSVLTIFLLMLVAPMIPQRWTFSASFPGDVAWIDIHRRWTGLLGGAAIWHALASIDPARGHILPRR